MITDLSTDPAEVETAATEIYPLAVDMAAILVAGESVTSPTPVLIDLTNGADVSATKLSGAAAVVGTEVQQSIAGLVPGHNYSYRVTFTATSGTHLTTETLIRCVF